MRANSFVMKRAPILIDSGIEVSLTVKQEFEIQYKNILLFVLYLLILIHMTFINFLIKI